MKPSLWIVLAFAGLACCLSATRNSAQGQFVAFAAAGEREESEPFEVQARGPVHEAFAAPVERDPEPGIVVAKQPPEPVPELPPDTKPEGDNVQWIPGYWAW